MIAVIVTTSFRSVRSDIPRMIPGVGGPVKGRGRLAPLRPSHDGLQDVWPGPHSGLTNAAPDSMVDGKTWRGVGRPEWVLPIWALFWAWTNDIRREARSERHRGDRSAVG